MQRRLMAQPEGVARGERYGLRLAQRVADGRGPRIEDRVEHQERPHRQDVGVSDLSPASAVVGGLRGVAEDQLDAAGDGAAPRGLELLGDCCLELLQRRAVRDGLEQRLVDVEQDVELCHAGDRPGAGAGELAQGVEKFGRDGKAAGKEFNGLVEFGWVGCHLPHGSPSKILASPISSDCRVRTPEPRCPGRGALPLQWR